MKILWKFYENSIKILQKFYENSFNENVMKNRRKSLKILGNTSLGIIENPKKSKEILENLRNLYFQQYYHLFVSMSHQSTNSPLY